MKTLLLILAAFFLFTIGTSIAQTDCAYEAEIEIAVATWGDEISWNIITTEGDVIVEGDNYNDYDFEAITQCFEEGCYILQLFDAFGDGWNGASISVNIPDLGIMFGDMSLDYGTYGAYVLSMGSECDDIETGGGDGGGNEEIAGCTDPAASNYNFQATTDDGSCVYPCEDGGDLALLYVCTFNEGQNVSLEITDENGASVYLGNSFGDLDIVYTDLCLGEGCFTATLMNTAGDGGWYNGYFYINSGGGQIAYATLPEDQTEWSFDFSLDGSCGDIFGCTDPDAPNYNAEATVDDGTCLPSCECEDDTYEPVCGYSWVTGELITFNNTCELECAGAYFYWEGDCSDQPVYGCMDSEALNYNPEATVDSGCLYPLECGDNTPLTIYADFTSNDDEWDNTQWFNWFITDFDNNAWYDFIQYAGADGNWMYEGCIADGCYNFTIYNAGFGGEEGTVIAVVGEDTLSFDLATDLPADVFQITYGLGVNVEDCEAYVPGCTDEEALNYTPNATEDNGSCTYPLVCEDGETPGQIYICTFSQGEAVGLTIEDEEGNVLYDQQGFNDMEILYLDVCLDSTACYTATMTNLNGEGSWYGGYFYVNAAWSQLVYESLDNDASSETYQFSIDGNCGEVYGCTDPDAGNFDPSATIDNGSCYYPVVCDDGITVTASLAGGSWLSEITWFLLGADGIVYWEGANLMTTGANTPVDFCVPAQCYTLIMLDDFGDGWDNSVLALTWGDETLEFNLEAGSYGEVQVGIGADCGDQPDPFVGCTDEGAINFNPIATEDDGSCEFAFCPTNEVTFVTVTLEDGNSLGWNLSDGTDAAGGNIEAGFYASNTTHTYTACLADDCYEVTMWDMNADGWNGGWIEVWMDGELMTTATMEDGFMESMNLGINTDCEEIGTGGSPFEFPDPIGFAPYPNPTEIETNLNGQGWDEHLPIEIEVRDVTGRLVSKYAFVPNASASNWILNTSSFEAGMYNIIGMQGRQSAHTSIMVR